MAAASQQIVVFEGQLTRQLASRFSRSKQGELDWSAEKQYALGALRKGEHLRKCSPESFALAMLDVAFSGLSLSPMLGHAWLLPYWNKDLNSYEVSFKPSYRGLAHLAYRAETLQSEQTVLVREGDAFQVRTVDNRRIVSHVEQNPNGKVLAAYTILKYTNGGEYVEVMTRTELDACKAQAKSNRGGQVWDGAWEPEMQKKACLRRALKHVPLDGGGKLAHALHVADKYEPMDFGNAAPALETEPTVLVSDEQTLKAHAALTDGGLDAKDADKWLAKLAEAMGHKRFADLPANRYDEAVKRLATRLTAWKASQK